MRRYYLVVCLRVCLRVCSTATRRYCIKMAKCRIRQTTPRDSSVNVFFWRWWATPFPRKFVLKVTQPPFKHHASTLRSSEKSLVSTNRNSTTHFPMSRRWTKYVTQRVAQNALLLSLSVKFNFCLKKSATKFLCVNTSSGKVVATSFLYLKLYLTIKLI